jgi:hypothetical protein
VTDALCQLLREKWASLLDEGFELIEERSGVVLLKSSKVSVRVVLDPRGELDVDVFPTGTEPHHGWAYTGIVGRASVGRLLEIALAQMRSEPAILAVEADFYDALAAEKTLRAHEMTEYYAGRGPRPGRQLP